MLSYILKLRKNIKTGLVTNNSIENTTFWNKKIHLDKYFDVIIISSEVAHKKPEPEIYRVACEKLNVNAGECIFVDDNDEPLSGAEKLGMKTHKFNLNKTELSIIKIENILAKTNS